MALWNAFISLDSPRPEHVKTRSLQTTCLLLIATLIGCDGSTGSSASKQQPAGSSDTVLQSDADVSRFLSRAAFGAKPDDLSTWRGRDAADWLLAELAKPPEPLLPAALDAAAQQPNGRVPFGNYNRYHLKRSLIESQADLRTKMTYALSHLLVVGGSDVVDGFKAFSGLAYHDALNENAFGNYRDLLTAVTYSPAMADWLTYLRNQPGDPVSGREPDENYARELMQLFTIGLHLLNQDGTPKRDSNGDLIPTYGNDDVAQLARVFTGLSHDAPNYSVWGDEQYAARARPLKVFDEHHSTRSKTFLDTHIPAGVGGDDSIRMALDALYNHPNMPPFVARQLIQKFTTSDPDPAYVARVANAFAEGEFRSANGTVIGRGVRGDLSATLAAILLDRSVFLDATSAVHTAKVRDPVLQYVNFMRAFKVRNLEYITRANRIGNLDDSSSLGMAYFESPSVFNFFRPGYVPPGTRAGDQGKTVPEFQAVQSARLVGYTELMTDLILERIGLWSCPSTPDSNFTGQEPCVNAASGPQFVPDYSPQMALAHSPTALTDHLDALLTGGRMHDRVRDRIVDSVSAIAVDPNSREEDLRKRVQVAVLMAVTAPSYAVVW